MTRQELEKELERLEPSARARAIHLRRDDASLERAIVRLQREADRIRRVGHVHATDIGLRRVDPAA